MLPSSGKTQAGLTCNACGITFDDRELQRTHMREPWHVLNVKRRVADLTPISKTTFEEQHPTRSRSSRHDDPLESQEDDTDEDNGLVERSENEPPTQCLFCQSTSTTIETNLAHMLAAHGLFISHLEHLIDVQSFIEYLRTVITESHECLYCGTTRSTTQGIRQHMLDKGHCLLNIEAEPELLEFWEFPDSSGGEDGEGEIASVFVSKTSDLPVFQKLSDTEWRLARGTVIGSRADGSTRQTNRKKRAAVREAKLKTIEDASTDEQAPEDRNLPNAVKDRRVAVRGELGMIGVTDQQKRALMAVEKKAQKQEEVVTASYEWSLERTRNKQKRSRKIVAKKGCVHLSLFDR